MSDLVKRLRDNRHTGCEGLRAEAAARIEELEEKESAEWVKANDRATWTSMLTQLVQEIEGSGG